MYSYVSAKDREPHSSLQLKLPKLCGFQLYYYQFKCVPSQRKVKNNVYLWKKANSSLAEVHNPKRTQ